MVFYRHIPIVPHDIDTIFFNSSRRKIPLTRITDIRLLQLLAIDKKPSVAKLNLLSLTGDHTFQKHHSAPRKANRYDVKPFRLGEKIGQTPAKIYTTIVIRRLHADPLNAEGNAEVAEKKIGEEHDREDPDQELSRQRWKKELFYPIIDGHIKYVATSIAQSLAICKKLDVVKR